MKLILGFILPFLLSSATAAASYFFPSTEVCGSSCGLVQRIPPPFRLKGDPSYCGEPEYEIACNGTQATLNLPFGQYHVIGISDSDISIVDVAMAGVDDGCALPLGSISPRALKKDNRFQLLPSYIWMSFVNCSTSSGVGRSADYRPEPCRGRGIYLVNGSDVAELEDSCAFVAMVPTDAPFNRSSAFYISAYLQWGFKLTWNTPRHNFGYCFMTYMRRTEYVVRTGISYELIVNMILFEKSFVECVYESGDASALPLAVIVVMVTNLLLFLLTGRLVIAPIVLLVFIVLKYRKMFARVDVVEKFLRNQPPLTPTRYEYSEIATMTGHFKEKLGQGGFGSVYKGKLPGGQLVAVKMLGKTSYNGEDFISEVATIGRIHHKNVVRLAGYCSDGSKRALVYECMPNGSLDKYIYSSAQRCFAWDELNDIALGVARGIDYLHRGCDMRILHFDIKPQNILLDHDFNPKVSDFGLAKLYPKDNSMVAVSVARGTIGYIAPELISRNFGPISDKSDVYSFGMLLLGITGGRKNVNVEHQATDDSSQFYYPSWIYDQLHRRQEELQYGTGAAIADGAESRVLLSEIGDVERKLCVVGLWCIQMHPSSRPTMSKVVEMLEGDISGLAMPPKPFFSAPELRSVIYSRLDSVDSELSVMSEDE